MSETATTSGMDFVMFQTKNMAVARAFYEGLFGWKASMEYEDFYVEYDLPDGTTFAIGRDPSAPFVAMGGIMFGVPDAAAARERAVALGAAHHKDYGGGSCTTAWCTDPDGNAFGLHERK
jgi:predicted enzyme related to lactoylglutathione lyase